MVQIPSEAAVLRMCLLPTQTVRELAAGSPCIHHIERWIIIKFAFVDGSFICKKKKVLLFCAMYYGKDGDPPILQFYSVRAEMRKAWCVFEVTCAWLCRGENEKPDVLIPMLMFIALYSVGIQGSKITRERRLVFLSLKIQFIYSKEIDSSNEHWKVSLPFISFKSCQKRPPAHSTWAYLF